MLHYKIGFFYVMGNYRITQFEAVEVLAYAYAALYEVRGDILWRTWRKDYENLVNFRL